jgi:ferredoxin
MKESKIIIPKVNTSCIWCWACAAIASNYFTLNDEWYSVVKKSDIYNKKDIDNAISACPVDAISWDK